MLGLGAGPAWGAYFDCHSTRAPFQQRLTTEKASYAARGWHASRVVVLFERCA